MSFRTKRRRPPRRSSNGEAGSALYDIIYVISLNSSTPRAVPCFREGWGACTVCHLWLIFDHLWCMDFLGAAADCYLETLAQPPQFGQLKQGFGQSNSSSLAAGKAH